MSSYHQSGLLFQIAQGSLQEGSISYTNKTILADKPAEQNSKYILAEAVVYGAVLES